MVPQNLIKCSSAKVTLNSPKIMGILNVTPDSFSDGNQFFSFNHAIMHAMQMIEEGADIIDIGGESTRPGATPVDPLTECQRVIPVIEYLKKNTSVTISIDTRHTPVMKEAIQAGASFINDVNALQSLGALELVATSKFPVCLMHMKGLPATMQQQPHYEHVLQEMYAFFAERIEACLDAGIEQKNIWIDPGFGFGKTLTHNLMLLGNLDFFKPLNCSILVGLSRKTMFGEILQAPVNNRLFASIAAASLAGIQGASIIRTHDVAQTRDALLVVQAILPYWNKEGMINVA